MTESNRTYYSDVFTFDKNPKQLNSQYYPPEIRVDYKSLEEPSNQRNNDKTTVSFTTLTQETNQSSTRETNQPSAQETYQPSAETKTPRTVHQSLNVAWRTLQDIYHCRMTSNNLLGLAIITTLLTHLVMNILITVALFTETFTTVRLKVLFLICLVDFTFSGISLFVRFFRENEDYRISLALLQAVISVLTMISFNDDKHELTTIAYYYYFVITILHITRLFLNEVPDFRK